MISTTIAVVVIAPCALEPDRASETGDPVEALRDHPHRQQIAPRRLEFRRLADASERDRRAVMFALMSARVIGENIFGRVRHERDGRDDPPEQTTAEAGLLFAIPGFKFNPGSFRWCG
ncbi:MULTISPECIES: hypothetical protein [unclassified Methylobacterium]|uniref:hypothetical protein n=1 Tax=unclassified Methylobacterium TaxID=2615210 RepID=UPI0036FD8802